MDAHSSYFSQGVVTFNKGCNRGFACRLSNAVQSLYHDLLNRIIVQMAHHSAVQFDNVHWKFSGQTVAFHGRTSAIQSYPASDLMQAVTERGYIVRVLSSMGFPDFKAEAFRSEWRAFKLFFHIVSEGIIQNTGE